jgi:hypothetical protein
MKNLPFSMFKRADRPCYLVSYKNEATGEYYPAISTRQKDEAEALKTDFAWLRDGIPLKRMPVKVQDLVSCKTHFSIFLTQRHEDTKMK